ncbi:enoyl-CoA hydratase/isomerase family protein [Maricaulis parjimensis]|uniref:enoyl-CoA hydratase/isomerase family protein n=1 Tax=Maricaulis parjimensis TaxID=144023 RepID=UPI00193A368A|nr:enoyl-CoA hydratase-related protein [Maricaulis parjimensis]
MTTSEPFLIRHAGDRAELILNRPEKRNAMTEAMWAQLPDLLASLAERCRVLVVRGAGEHFASGADISEFEAIYETQERGEANSASIAAGLEALARFPHPTIAAVRGACVGGGCGIALACDLRFADTSSRLAITPAKMGLLYPFGDTKRLVETVGPAMAKDMLFSARVLAAEEALDCGLIDRLFSPDALDGEIEAYCNRLLDMSPRSATYTKAMIARILDGQDHDDDDTRAWFANAFSSADFKEGYKAFLEKRKPDFSGRKADH